MFTSIKHKSNTNHNSTKASTERDLDWAIGWIRVALQILGLWTYPKQSKFTAVLSHIHTAVLALVIFFLQILPQTIALIKVWGMTGLIIDNITMNLPSMVAEFKFIVLWYKKHDLAGIFAMITQDWLGKKSNRERDVMIKCAKISKIFTIGGSIGSIACANLIFTPVIFNTVIRTVNNITDIPDRLFALQTVYFHDVTQLEASENQREKTLHFNQSESLFTAVYNCNWVTLTPSEFRQIILILIRTRQPLYITAGKFSPIIKTSCGWVSVLLAAKNKF
ncbi:hypothetical protein PV326_014002 [Microctonus aethiopoides]|nr:hypothetical protein PV326_014002 [Microctonus aethiopoides]